MKRKSFTQPIKQTLLAVSASALMLGASQAQTTVGINFQGGDTFYGGAYSGALVTDTSFGVPVADWFTDASAMANGSMSAGTSASLTVNWTSANTWVSLCEGDPNNNWNNPLPGNPEVLWGYLDDTSPGNSVTVSGLASTFPHGYVIQTIAAEDSNPMTFANSTVSDGVTTNTLTYSYYWHLYDWNGPVNGANAVTAGLSLPSGTFTSDSITVSGGTRAGAVRAPLCGFIITDQPVVSLDPVGVTSLVGTTITLSASVVAHPNGLHYQWQKNGSDITGANTATYTKAGATAGDSGNYTLVVTNLYGSATSAAAAVAIVSTDIWIGNVNGTWDIAGTANWTSSGVTATYTDGDAVQFDDTAAGTTVVSNAVTVSPISIMVTNNTKGYVISGSPIDGGASLTKSGTNALTLSGANTFTGNVTINAGALTIGDPGQLGGGTYAGSIVNNGAFNYNSSAAQTISGLISGTGSLTQNGPGTLTLNSVSSTLTGPVVVNGGALTANGPSANGSLPHVASITVNNGGSLVCGANGLVGYNQNIVPVTINAGGIMTVDGGTGGGPNLYGTLTLAGGTVEDGGSLHPTYGSYNFGGKTIIANGATTSSITAQDFQFRFATTVEVDSGSILDVTGYFSPLGHNGTDTLTKTGAGTLILAGANTYGSTIVSNGTLEVDGSLPASALTVAANATLTGTGTINGPTTIQAGGTVELGTSISTLSIYSSLSLAGNAVLKISKTGGTPASDNLTGMSAVTYGGILTVTNITSGATALAEGDTFTLFTIASGSYNGAFTTFNLPPLPTGLNWDRSQLTLNGKIAVVSSVPAPVFSPAAGGYAGALSVTISSAAGSTIYYTTDGSTPTTSSPSGLSPVTGIIVPANTNLTITAFATKAGSANSPVASATYATVTTPTWINPNGGSWAAAANWSNNVVASGSGATADFSTLTMSGDGYVTLDAANTIGYLVFGDVGNTYNWDVETGSSGPLNLDAGTNSPTITVRNNTTTLGVTLAGSGGLTKAGDGVLDLTANEAYTGGTIVNAGSLYLSGGGNGFNNSTLQGTLTINRGATCLLNSPYALGQGGGGLTDVYLDGGTLTGANCDTFSISYHFDGGILALSGNAILGLVTGYGYTNVVVTSVSNAVTAVMAVTNGLILNATFLQTNYVFDVAKGATPTSVDLQIAAGISQVNVNGSGPSSIIKTGAGTLELVSGYTNTYTGGTTVSNGTLLVDAVLAGGGAVIVAPGGQLAGTGTINGQVTINSGGTLSAGDASLGTLTLASTLTLNAGSATMLKLDKATHANDSVAGISTLTYGGTLTVTNLAGTLAQGDSFPLFNATTYNGNFAAMNLPALGAGLVWSWTPANGTLTVVQGETPPVLSGFGPLTGSSFPLTFSGPSGQTYKVLASTNVALPLASWMELTNGTFGASAVTYTDTAATNMARFYRIVSP